MTNERELVRGKTGFDMVVRTPEERERVYNPTPSEVADLLMLSTGRASSAAEEKPAEHYRQDHRATTRTKSAKHVAH